MNDRNAFREFVDHKLVFEFTNEDDLRDFLSYIINTTTCKWCDGEDINIDFDIFQLCKHIPSKLCIAGDVVCGTLEMSACYTDYYIDNGYTVIRWSELRQ